jgi:hypothetical protein
MVEGRKKWIATDAREREVEFVAQPKEQVFENPTLKGDKNFATQDQVSGCADAPVALNCHRGSSRLCPRTGTD